jgi:DNA-binding LytR/AlgR family response regulator
MAGDLAGARILVVEDEYFIARDIENALLALGGEVAGPVATRDQALALLEKEPIDLAVLDINLQGEMSFGVARALSGRGTPYIFATGYEEASIPHDLHHVPIWKKPFDTDGLAAALAAMRRSADPA